MLTHGLVSTYREERACRKDEATPPQGRYVLKCLPDTVDPRSLRMDANVGVVVSGVNVSGR